MSVSMDNRILQEQEVAGVTSTARPSWFVAHDEAPMGYWKRPSDGHVILAQYGDNGTERKLDRGFVRLGRYGSFSSAAMGDLRDPYLPLVTKGGLSEMPADQIKQLGWHRTPDRAAKRSHREVDRLVSDTMQRRGIDRQAALLVVMPQLAEIDLTDYDCAACPGRFFPHKAAAMAHESVVHKDAVQSRSIGTAVAQAQAGAAGSDSAALLTLIAQQGETIAALTARLDSLQSASKAKPAAKADAAPAN